MSTPLTIVFIIAANNKQINRWFRGKGNAQSLKNIRTKRVTRYYDIRGRKVDRYIHISTPPCIAEELRKAGMELDEFLRTYHK